MRIKALLLGAATGALLTAPALAADLPIAVKAPPLVYAPVFTWTGLYAGANVGYGWGEGSAPWDNYLAWHYAGWDATSYSGGSDPTGWFGGVQAGYNYQFTNNVVLGVEADFEFGSLNDKLNYSAFDAGLADQDFGSIETKIETFGTVRARLGYAMDRFLPYVTGGLAWGTVKVSENWSSFTDGAYDPFFSGSASKSQTLWGWTIGGGLEYAVTDNWTVKAEYLYADLGDINWDSAANTSIDVKLQTVKLGVNYKF
ncbi:porin family protein [Starkeya koreensis]|uniref:Porin family protein n=1 Tax=Ancylobacter koreensis TaxID=266121 RepID=A0ABT0DPU2_9HYPH|nr:outer membrane protein [Ancylobacter koreensis]MCK0209214.1 porin family protein [Ancylobacter koreensis]